MTKLPPQFIVEPEIAEPDEVREDDAETVEVPYEPEPLDDDQG